MKKIFKKAFTLIELLVIISIISIVWIFSMNSFLDFYKSRDFITRISNLENTIKELDLKILKKEIYDYKILIEKEKNFIKIYENNILTWEKISIEKVEEDKIKLKIDKKIIKDNLSDKEYFEKFKKEKTDFFNIKIYKNWHFKEEIWKNIDNLDINVDKKNNYTFLLSTFEWNLLNNISLFFYDTEKEIILKNISKSEDKTNSFSELKIENINWKKIFYLDWNIWKKVYLFFENEDWQTNYLLLKN